MARKGQALVHTLRSKGSRSKYSGQHVPLGFKIPPAISDTIKRIDIARAEVASGKS
jgi:hypothetical protein